MKIYDYIFDELDVKLKEYVAENKETPESVVMDIYTYLEFKEELGYGDDRDKVISNWAGFSIIVNAFDEERTLRFI